MGSGDSLGDGPRNTRAVNAVISAIAATAAIIVLVYVVNAVYPISGMLQRPVNMGSHRVAEWPQIRNTGVLLGRADAPIVIAEFSDFQCPACAQAHAQLQDLQHRFGDRLAISFHHYPLDGAHPYARSAAIAAECARAQGRFRPIYDLLFNEQDSIGIRRWDALATDVGVADLSSFRRCVTDEQPMQRIRADEALGDKIGVSATPTLIVEGLMLPAGVPGQDTLVDMIERIVSSSGTE